MIECQICKKQFGFLSYTHLFYSHNIQMKDYKRLFPNYDFGNSGENNGMFGKPQSDNLKEINRKRLKGKKATEIFGDNFYAMQKLHNERIRNERKNKTWEEIYGIDRAKEAKNKLSISSSKVIHTQDWNRKDSLSQIGHPCYSLHSRGISGIRKDLGKFYRSKYEANFARILNYLKIEYDYEICRFIFDDCSYLPDFYLPYFDIWVECKGYLTQDARHKLDKIYKNYPEENVKIIDGEVYKILTKLYKDSITGWEK